MTAPAASNSGAAKWAAIFLLGSAAGGGLVYSVAARAPAAGSVAPTPLAAQPAAQATPTAPVIVQVMPQPPTVFSVPGSQGPPTGIPANSAQSPPPISPAPSAPPLAIAPTAESPAPSTTSPAEHPGTEAPKTSPKPAPAAAPARKININTAGAAELELLPNVGPALAKRIVDDREKNGAYRNPRDLTRVKGIGPKILDKILPLVTIDKEPSPR
ncbi:MAG: helix-hairpin-helix domain-containing protein [Planctomycetes bacterium]|nr:helix-hairpin-helix domain-containing protein [Planctomycetota bacterium]